MPDLATVLSTAGDLPAAPPPAASPPDASQPSSREQLPSWVDDDLANKLRIAVSPPSTETTQQPKLPPGTVTGYGPNLAAGVAQGGVALPINTATDPFGNLIGKPLETLAFFAHDVIGPKLGLNKPFSPEDRAKLQEDFFPQGGTVLVNKAARTVGLPTPDEVKPEPGTGQDIARSAAAGAAALPMLGAKALAGVVVGGLSGAAGQTVSDALPAEWKDVGNLITQVLAGGATAGTIATVKGGARVAGRAASTVFPGKQEDIINPATGQPFTAQATGEPLTASASQKAAVGRMQAAAAGTEPGEIAGAAPSDWRVLNAGEKPPEGSRTRYGKNGLEVFEPGAAAAQQPGNVPGAWRPLEAGETPPADAQVRDTPAGQEVFEPKTTGTLGQQTGNLPLMGRERALRNTPYGRAAFTAKEAADNLQQVAALRDIAPGDVADAAREFFQAKRRELQQQAEGGTGAAEQAAATVTEGAGIRPGEGMAGAQEIGTAQREALETQRQPVKNALSARYEALPAEDTLDTSPVYEAQKRIRAELGKGGELTGDEKAVMEAARDFRGVNTLGDLRSLQSNLAAKLKEVARDQKYGVESQPYRRLSQLMASVTGSMDEAAARAIEREAAAGTPAGQRIVDRIINAETAGAGQAGAERAGVAGQPASGRTAAPDNAGEAGAAPPASGTAVGPAGSEGNRGVAPPPATEVGPPPPRKPESMEDFLIAKGGIKPNGETRAMDLDKIHHKGAGRLVNAKGMDHDRAREALIEEGFLRPGDDINAMYDKLAEGRAGNQVYRPADDAVARDWRNYQAEAQQRENATLAARDKVIEAEDRLGVRMSPEQLAHAQEMLVREPDMHPHQAVRDAMRASEETEHQNHTQRQAFGRPGVAPGAEQAEAPIGSRGEETFQVKTASEVGRLNRDYRDYKDTWRLGAVGKALRSGPGPGGYAADASSVPGLFFKRGPGGAEAADSLIRARGGVPEAEALVSDHAALVLRNRAMASGAWNDKAYTSFMNDYAAALSKYPGIAKRFQTVAEAQREVFKAAEAGQQRVQDFENSAAKYYLGKGEAGVDNQTAIDRLTRAENSRMAARDLMQQAAGNDAATAGIRRNLMEWAEKKITSTREGGATGVSELSDAAAQRLNQNAKVRAVMEEVLTPAQLRRWDKTVGDLREAARAWNAVAVKGSPGTAADFQAAGKGHGFGSMLSQWIFFDSFTHGLLHLANVKAPGISFLARGLSYASSKWSEAVRAAGLTKRSDLMTEGVLNPALGRIFDQAAVADERSPLIAEMARRIFLAAVNSQQQRQDNDEATRGR